MTDLELKCPYCRKSLPLKLMTEEEKDFAEFQEILRARARIEAIIKNRCKKLE